MLSQIVRPMVSTQIRLLASTQATRSTLIQTIAKWLGFLGVRAEVTQLDANSNQIRIALIVNQPEGCDHQDWQQIIHNLSQSHGTDSGLHSHQHMLKPQQQSKLQRLLASLIQAGNPEELHWEAIHPQLQTIGLEESMLLGIKSALKVPQPLDTLIEGLDPDVAAIALPIAISIALLDGRVNNSEDRALTALLRAMEHKVA